MIYCTNCGHANDDEHVFCQACGTKLPRLTTEETLPEMDSTLPSTSPAVPLAVPVESAQTTAPKKAVKAAKTPKETTSAAVSTAGKKDNAEMNKKLPLYIGIGCGALLLVALIIAAVIFLLPNLSLGGGKSDYYAALREDGIFSGIDVLYRVSADGKKQTIFAEDRNGFEQDIFSSVIDVHNARFSPDGKMLALFEESSSGDMGDLVIYREGQNSEVVLDDGLFVGGFSPNGKYYAAVRRDSGERETLIFDMDGKEVFALEDADFIGFVDNDQFLYFEFSPRDNDNSGIGIASIRKASDERLFRLRGSEVSNPFFSAFLLNGDLYYVDESSLFRTDTAGKTQEEIYEFNESSIIVLPDPASGMVIVWDSDSYWGSEGELSVIDSKDNVTRISRKAIINWNFYPAQMVALISPNGKYIAYLETSRRDGESQLMGANIDGSNPAEIAIGEYITARFAADNKHIVYILHDEYTTGSLYINSLDGTDEIRLDRDVWSFFVDKNIVYTKLTDGETDDRPESQIFRVDLNGKNPRSVSDVYDGLITLFSNP
jgi:hypothetical protein